MERMRVEMGCRVRMHTLRPLSKVCFNSEKMIIYITMIIVDKAQQ
jgi:hypothetical protein